jgi:hypothetical protein
VQCNEVVELRYPVLGALLLFRSLVHCIIIRPAIEVRWLDILLTQQSGYLRTMVDGVVDSLDQHDDNWRVISSSVKMEDLTQIPLLSLLCDRDQLFSRVLCSSPQFAEGWKMCEVCKSRGRVLNRKQDGVSGSLA